MEDIKLSLDDIALAEKFPEVSEHAIGAFKEKEIKAQKEVIQQSVELQKDVKLKKDGTPAKKRGRKSLDEKTKTDSAFFNPREANKASAQEISSHYAATVTSGIIESVTVAMISKDFQLNDIERVANVKAWADTFDYYGGVSLTPPQALMLNQAGIFLTRFGASKETQSKLALGKAWLKDKYVSFKNRKKKNAQPDNRTDIERKDNASQKVSETPQVNT